MKIYESASGMVFNCIDETGLQTSVKVEPSGHFDSSALDRSSPHKVDKEKYSVIVSSSVGCPLNCEFCHLTKSGKQYKKVPLRDVYWSTIDAVEYAGSKIDLSKKYVKLCFMGEGEALVNPQILFWTAPDIISQILDGRLAIGVDGIDVSTSFPKIDLKDLPAKLEELEYQYQLMYATKLNPNNHNSPDRSILRLFYSLHHYDEEKRAKMIPNTHSIKDALGVFDRLNTVNGIVHYMFIEGVNDSPVDIERLVKFVDSNPVFSKLEFRVLRYNGYSDNESPYMKDIIERLERDLKVKKFKVQYSAGEDVKAACGMFV